MQLLTTNDLAKRWGLTPYTIKRWRMDNLGPAYFKLGVGSKSCVRYRLEDVETFEQTCMVRVNNKQEAKA